MATPAPHWTSINVRAAAAQPTAVVVGAGAMGGWTAFSLVQQGYQVTLCDPWGPGNARASSGGETRLIRCLYGDSRVYFDLARRALTLWRRNETLLGKKFLYNTGLLIFCGMERYDYAEQARPFYQEANMTLERLAPEAVQRRFPGVNVADLNHAIYDPAAGYLLARESCAAVADYVVQHGGRYVQAPVKPGAMRGGKLRQVTLPEGTALTADVYAFAPGPWLGPLFPELLGSRLRVTRQPLFMFGTPAGAAAMLEQLPTWMNRDRANVARCYGVPGSAQRGFKIQYTQQENEPFDPTHDDRRVRTREIEKARALLAHRFPPMKDAPLLESRVCQHTDTPDRHFLMDRHPEAGNLWLLGGGSGHAFKHGPALGELAAQLIEGETTVPSLFSLARLAALPEFTQQHR